MSIPRYSRVFASATQGIEAVPVTVETSIIRGIPRHTVVGLARGAVRESLDRIRSAIRASGHDFPRGSITINLAPADVHKDGSSYDLPLAIGVLLAEQAVRPDGHAPNLIWLGELSLDGEVRPVPGVLSAVLKAEIEGCDGVVVPVGNEVEALEGGGVPVYPVRTLSEAIGVLKGERKPSRRTPHTLKTTRMMSGDIADVIGQGTAKKVLEIAAVGGHNVLLEGPPGCGKTMLARRFTSILPQLHRQEAVESTCIHSLRGLIGSYGMLRSRPFRSPHHSVTRAGMLGGGRPVLPGEVSLAHNGVLFLDELPEFSRPVLESLREPLEEKEVTISRASGPLRYPAGFQLIAAMNPCPCGYGNQEAGCTCTTAQKHRYRSSLSGPLLDRIDMQLTLQPVKLRDLDEIERGESSDTVRARVEAALAFRAYRLASVRINNAKVFLSPEALTSLNQNTIGLGYSMRTRKRVLHVARSIADLAGREVVDFQSISEAIRYRCRENRKA